MEKGIELVRPGQAEVTADLGALFRGAIRMVLEYLLNEEVSQLIGAERYQRIASRSDYRNGSYLRRLATALGWIELEVPRPRTGPTAGGRDSCNMGYGVDGLRPRPHRPTDTGPPSHG